MLGQSEGLNDIAPSNLTDLPRNALTPDCNGPRYTVISTNSRITNSTAISATNAMADQPMTLRTRPFAFGFAFKMFRYGPFSRR